MTSVLGRLVLFGTVPTYCHRFGFTASDFSTNILSVDEATSPSLSEWFGYWTRSCVDAGLDGHGAFLFCKFEHSTCSNLHVHLLMFHILSISCLQTSHSPAQTSHIHKFGIRPGFLAHSSGNTTSLSYPQTAQRTFMSFTPPMPNQCGHWCSATSSSRTRRYAHFATAAAITNLCPYHSHWTGLRHILQIIFGTGQRGQNHFLLHPQIPLAAIFIPPVQCKSCTHSERSTCEHESYRDSQGSTSIFR